MYFLVYLDRGIYLPHERVGANISDCSAHYTQGQAEQRHVTKIKRRLEETVHFSFEEKVVKGINVDVTSRRSCRKKTRPLPSIVFGI